MTPEDFKPNPDAACQHEMRFMSHRENGKRVCCLCRAVEAEREACAQVVDGWYDKWIGVGHPPIFPFVAKDIAVDIRARSNPKADSAKAE